MKGVSKESPTNKSTGKDLRTPRDQECADNDIGHAHNDLIS